MSCTYDHPHDDCPDVTHKFQALRAERDQLKARMEAAEAVIYSGLDSEDVKKAKLDAWRKTRGIGC